MDSAEPQYFEFRGFQLDRRKRALVDPAGVSISLNAKAFDTLVYFLRHPGQVLDRTALLEAIWPSAVVEENNLSQAVGALRRVLGDGFIVTVTGRGYQFVADVEARTEPPEESARPRWPYFAAAVLALAISTAVLVSLAPKGPSGAQLPAPSEHRRSIAVLPFENESAAGENTRFFANGIHDELLTRLVRVRDLKVISRASVETYRDSSKSLREIGRELGVVTLLTGRVQRSANRLRISVQLVDAETDEHLWAQTYDRELSAENVFAIQSDMAISIAGALHATLSPGELSLLENVPTRSTRAYDFFLTGAHYFRDRTDPQNFIPLAQQALERAVEEDPEFAWGWALLSITHGEMYWFHIDRSYERLERAERAARRALELAPDVPEIHLAMAMYHYRSASDYDAALAELAIAERGCPECAEILSVRGSVNRRRGLFEESLADFERIVDRDPRNVFQLSAHFLVNYKYMRDYPRAAQTVERILELAPDDPRAHHERALLPMLREGDTTLLRESSRTPPTPDYFSVPNVRIDLWRSALYERDYDGAVAEMRRSDVPDDPLVVPELYVGLAELLAGRSEKAAGELETARVELERRLEQTTDDPSTEAVLRVLRGYTLAGLDEPAAAIEAARRARALLPKTRDALSGAWVQYHAIHVFALAGAEDAALEELADYLAGYGPWSIEGMLPDPRLDSIRAHPRLSALLQVHGRRGSEPPKDP